MGRKPTCAPKKARAATAGLGGGQEKVQRDLSAEQHKQCMSTIMSCLKDSPPKALRVMAALQSGFFDKDPASSASECDSWPKTYVWFKQVGEYWLSAWLVKNVPHMTLELIDLVDEADPWGIRKLVDFGCGTMHTQKLPRPCLSKLALGLTLTRRYIRRGRLLDDFVQLYISKSTGEVNWSLAGAWRFVTAAAMPECDVVTTIVYRPSNTRFAIADKGWHITTEWAIASNWHDHNAYTEKDIAKVHFSSKLAQDLKLGDMFSFESFNTEAREVATMLEQKQMETAALVVPSDPSLVTAKRRKKAPEGASATPLVLTSS